MSLTLHSYWRAGAPYRVRIGLALKGLDYAYAPVDLAAGQQREPAYRAHNPQGLTPAVDLPDGHTLTQSLAILEWLEEAHPEPPILPRALLDRAVVRQMAALIACDIHPLNNLRVARRLRKMGLEAEVIQAWAQGWIAEGFEALEPLLAAHAGAFSFGDTPTLADCFLIPQVYSAERYQADLAPYPTIRRIVERAAAHPAFHAAHPENQPDAVKT